MIAANRVRLAFEAAGRVLGEHQLGATVSIGAAGGAGDIHIERLIGNADAMLYRAKQNGRNRVEAAPAVVPEETAAPADPGIPVPAPA